jgi:hypothetical protein
MGEMRASTARIESSDWRLQRITSFLQKIGKIF